MTNEISAADSRILTFQMRPGDYPDFIPLTAVQINNPHSKQNIKSDVSSFPSEVVDVYATLDNTEMKGAKGQSSRPPSIVRFSKLANSNINFVAGNSTCVYAISNSNRLLVSHANIEEERDSNTEFINPREIASDYCYSISCGMNHAVLLAVKPDSGSTVVYATGSNSEGQCGFKGVDFVTHFRQLQFPGPTPRFVQVACGNNFTFLLTDTCDVWSFGHNHHGQLGLGTQSEIINTPSLVNCLNGLPITSIAAGLGHSLALTSTGLVYACGRNDKGQLGTTSQSTNTFIPVDSLSGVFVVHISACHNNSACIDEFGTVYLWGEQWGSTPRAVTLDAPDQFVDIAVGNDGRFAALSSENALYVYGYYLENGMQMTKVIKLMYPQQPYFRVFSCGNFFTVLAGPNKPLLTDSCNAKCFALLPPNRPIIKDRLRAPPKVLLLNGAHFPIFVTFKNAKQIIAAVFSNLGTINGSFILDRFSESQQTCGVDIELVNSVYEQFSSSVSKPLMDELNNSFTNTMKRVLQKPPALLRPGTMRFLITALLHPTIKANNSAANYEFWDTLICVILKLHSVRELLIMWLSQMQKKTMLQILKSLNDFLCETTRHTGIYGKGGRDTVEVIRLLWTANSRSQVLSFEDFYNYELCERVEATKELAAYFSTNDDWCYCKSSPWLMTPAIKTAFVRTRAETIMNQFYINACARATVYSGGHPVINVDDVWLVIEVKRDRILTTTIQALQSIKNLNAQMQKRLKVKFEGEPGVDEGGVQREFFDLVVKKLTSPDLSLFSQMRDFYWFNKDLDDGLIDHMKLAGQIVGLAIYNGNLLNIRFPLALYKKLRGTTVGINDLEEIDPQVVSTLMNILAYDGDVETDMCLDFTYNGENLIPKGNEVSVTNMNRQRYVDLIVDYLLNKSIEKQFMAFKEGFLSAAVNLTLPLFRPEELSLLVAGEEELDFGALEANTTYENYSPISPAVKLFWKIVRGRLNIEEKRKLLYFVTSSPRAPIGGLGKVPFKIMRDGDPNHIPTSHTCFYILVLPDITDEETMLKKLRIAIENSQGFQFK